MILRWFRRRREGDLRRAFSYATSAALLDLLAYTDDDSERRVASEELRDRLERDGALYKRGEGKPVSDGEIWD